MAVDEVLMRMGGVASRAALVATCGRAAVDRAVAGQVVVVVARGRYALPLVDEATKTAAALGGLLCLESAALDRGWEVKSPPRRPQILVPKNRVLSEARRRLADVHHADVAPGEADGHRTGVELTLTQCLRRLPFDAALAVADSALRHGVTPSTLQRVAISARGPESVQVRRVAAVADARAANPFESVLRAICLGVPGLRVRPQPQIDGPGWSHWPDLVDADLRIVAEADSFEWHGGRAALRRDARRYDELTVAGWRVLRFAWEDVMHDPAWVRQILVSAVALVEGGTKRGSRARKAA